YGVAMMASWRSIRELSRCGTVVAGVNVVVLFLLALAPISAAQTQPPPARTIVFDSDRTGRSEIYVQYLDIRNNLIGSPTQLTNAGGGQQAAQEPQWSLAASVNASVNPDSLGRIVYQFGAPGARGLHIIKPIAASVGNGDVQLTPQPLNGAIAGGPLKGKPYPCTDARDPSWSPDGLHIVYACLEPLTSGIGSSYDLWIHDTNGTPDDPKDDADYPLLILNGPLALRPAWSPDGSMMAFVTNMPGATATGPTSKIGLITLPNQFGTVLYSAKILTDDPYSDIAPTWDPSSSFIAFSSTRKQNAGGNGFTNGS